MILSETPIGKYVLCRLDRTTVDVGDVVTHHGRQYRILGGEAPSKPRHAGRAFVERAEDNIKSRSSELPQNVGLCWFPQRTE